MSKMMSRIATPVLILATVIAFSGQALAKKSVFSLPKVQKIRALLLSEDMRNPVNTGTVLGEIPEGEYMPAEKQSEEVKKSKISEELAFALEQLRKY